jgi:hypothetical protein
MGDYLIITTCTNRKREPTHPLLSASGLTPGAQQVVSNQWRDAVTLASKNPSGTPATELYCGRGFQEVLAASSANQLWIISAGLGLISANDQIHSYCLTIVPGAKNSVHSLMDSFHAGDWWDCVTQLPTSQGTISASVNGHSASLIVLAISSNYYSLIEPDLLGLAENDREKLRIVGVPRTKVTPKLMPNVMPYSDRLNGPDSPIPGTRSDFPQRATRHFVELLSETDGASVVQHADAVTKALEGLREPEIHKRPRLEDHEVKATIRRHWDDVDGRSAHMLRYLRRDLNLACEQSRFAELFRQIKKEREGQIT